MTTEELVHQLMIEVELLRQKVDALSGEWEWVKLSIAATRLGVNPQTLRRKIAENNTFKKGIHWRGNSRSGYQINLIKWQQAMSLGVTQ